MLFERPCVRLGSGMGWDDQTLSHDDIVKGIPLRERCYGFIFVLLLYGIEG